MLEKVRFCVLPTADAGAGLFRHEKVDLLRPRARLGASTEITKKKEVVSVRAVREVLHHLVIFLSGTRKNAGWKRYGFADG